MQNNYYPDPGSGQYQNSKPQQQAGNSMASFASQGHGMCGPPAPMYPYQQMAAYFNGAQGYPPPTGSQQLQSFNGYVPQHGLQQYGHSYGPSHMASYANGTPARRSTLSVIPPMDIGMAPIAIKLFAERDEEGYPTTPMFLTAPNYEAGVVLIQHNPFNIRINEILVALGQECIIQDYPQSSGIYAVHIIQDRMTGKTNDIYVELKDWAEADKVIRRYNAQAQRERTPKLGSRRAKMTLATSSHMMKAVFPRAKCTWANGRPERPEQWLVDNPCQWDGFITKEEMVKVLLFAEQPSSSKTRFAQDSPERVYQFMITSMQKIPWDADRFYFPKEWVVEFHAVLGRMAVRLANLVKDRQHVNLDSKLLEQFMKVMKSSPMYGNGDAKSMDNYMSIAEKVDEVMSKAHNVVAPPHRRNTNASNNGGSRARSRARNENTLMEGLRGMHLSDRANTGNRDRSPMRRDYRDFTPTGRDQSPARRNQSPVRRDQSPVRRDQSPARRGYSPARRDQSPMRREQSTIRRDHSPVRREYSPVRRDRSPARGSEQYTSEYLSRASHRATASGSPQRSSFSGRRSTLMSGGQRSSQSSSGYSARRHYED